MGRMTHEEQQQRLLTGSAERLLAEVEALAESPLARVVADDDRERRRIHHQPA